MKNLCANKQLDYSLLNRSCIKKQKYLFFIKVSWFSPHDLLHLFFLTTIEYLSFISHFVCLSLRDFFCFPTDGYCHPCCNCVFKHIHLRYIYHPLSLKECVKIISLVSLELMFGKLLAIITCISLLLLMLCFLLYLKSEAFL